MFYSFNNDHNVLKDIMVIVEAVKHFPFQKLFIKAKIGIRLPIGGKQNKTKNPSYASS